MSSDDTQTLEVMPATVLEAETRALIDVQIATAKRFPRDIPACKVEMMSLATIDQETAESCFYSLPRGDKPIKGESVRLAEIALSCYGNSRAATRTVEVDATSNAPHVCVQSVVHDLQKNVSVTIEKRRRITKKKSKPTIDEDDINLAVNACSAIAFRDAVFKVIPKALIKPVYEQCRKVAIGDAKTLNERRAKAVETFKKMGVKEEKIYAKLGKKRLEDLDLEDLETLIGLHTAIKDGELNVDDAFAVRTAEDAAKTVDDLADKLEGKNKPAAQEPPAHDPETGEIAPGVIDQPVPESSAKAASKMRRAPAEKAAPVASDGQADIGV